MRFLLLILILSFLNCSPVEDCSDPKDYGSPNKTGQIDSNKEILPPPKQRLVQEFPDLYDVPIYYDRDLDFYCQQEVRGTKCLPIKLETITYGPKCEFSFLGVIDTGNVGKYFEKIKYTELKGKFYPAGKVEITMPVCLKRTEYKQLFLVSTVSNIEAPLEIFAEIK